MEPVTSLILAVGGNFLSDGLKSGYRSLSDDDFQDYFDAAADRTAEEFDLDSDAFGSLFHANLPAEDLAAFEEKSDRTAHRDFATRLQTATDTTLDNPEQVVTAFFRNIEIELAHTSSDHGIRILLEYAHEFIDSQERRAEFEAEFETEIRHLEDFVESAHEATQGHVTEEHQKTRNDIVAEIEKLPEMLEAETEEDSLPDSFQRLASIDFETTRDIERCWRIGFNFAEIRAGYAFERKGKANDSTTAIEELRAKLLDDEDVVVLGRPGSGKSTICKAVACRWHARDDGDVFYYDPDEETPLSDTDGLETSIEQANGDCLVVAEDAIRPQVNDVFDVLDQFRGDNSVHFLFDARIEEWQSGDDLLDASATEARDLWSHGLTEYPLAPLTAEECADVIDHFEAETGHSVRELADRIHEQLQKASGTGEMLLLGYYLARQTTEGRPSSQRVSSDSVNPLKSDVRETYDWLQRQDNGDEPGLHLQVGVLVALLKAARIGVQTELVYALGDSRDEYEAIEEVLAKSTGQLVFEQNGGYETHHELWAVLFLEHLLNQMGDRRGAETFETCVNMLFALFDTPEKREDIHRWSRGRLDFPDVMDENTEAFAGEVVRTVFDLGTRRPKLAPLFGQTDYSGIKLPDICSEAVEVAVINKRGKMYFNRSDYTEAKDEFERVECITGDSDNFDAEETKRWRAISLGNLGGVTHMQGAYDDARQYHHKSLELEREVDNTAGVAKIFNNLGLVAYDQGAYDDARQYYYDSLEPLQKLDNKATTAAVLCNIGVVAHEQSAYDDAQQYYRNSLELHRELGDKTGIAANLGNLGNIAYEQRAYGDARQYHQDSLERKRELGDTDGVARTLTNLGNIAYEQGEYDDAQEHYHNSLKIDRKTGNKKGVAKNLTNLGGVTRQQGAYDDAKEFYKRAVKQFQELKVVVGTLTVLENLVRIEHRLGEIGRALHYCETAFDRIEQAEASGADEFVETFQHLQTSLELIRDESCEDTRRLYQQALKSVTEGEARTGASLFRDLWDRREKVDTDSGLFDIVLSAGIGLAVFFEMDEKYPKYEQESVLEEITPHADRLSPPALALYNYLADCDTNMEATSEDAEEKSLQNLERRAYGALRSTLLKEDMTATDWYTSALARLLQDDVSAWHPLRQAWNYHSELNRESEEYEHVLGAGITLATRLTFVDNAEAGEERAAILDTVRDHQDRLSKPMRTLFEAMVGDAPETDPDEIAAGVDPDADTYSLADYERLACAELLRDLDAY